MVSGLAFQANTDAVHNGVCPDGGLFYLGQDVVGLGLQGQGLSPKQMALCDSFVYIAQYGAGTASLNVTVATTVVLHHFALWAGYQEHARDGYKYVVAPKPLRTHSRGGPAVALIISLHRCLFPYLSVLCHLTLCPAHTRPAHTHISRYGLQI